MLSEKAVRAYAQTSAATAGVLKSYQLLVEKALTSLLRFRQDNHFSHRDLAQDIVAQIQHGLNLSFEASAWLYESLGIIWDSLEGGPEELNRAEDLLRQLRELLVEMQKK
ncbi:MAG: hypothetical protein GX801_02770 [Fibrobacter sp.]|nr:hypothetical protein [Fibrobacter sp.]